DLVLREELLVDRGGHRRLRLVVLDQQLELSSKHAALLVRVLHAELVAAKLILSEGREGPRLGERGADPERRLRLSRAGGHANEKSGGDDDPGAGDFTAFASRRLTGHFAAAGNAGSLPMSRMSCWMTTVALSAAAIFLKRSSEAMVCARSVLKLGTPFVS